MDKTVRITYKNDSNCLSESDMGARTLNNCFEKHVNDDLKCVFPWHLDLEDHRREVSTGTVELGQWRTLVNWNIFLGTELKCTPLKGETGIYWTISRPVPII